MSRPQTIDRQKVQQELILKGRELFAQQGLKGTSIRDLTLAVGIAQGSFYSLFESKEMLFFEILEQEEATIAQKIVGQFREHELTRGHLQSVIKLSLAELRGNPILRTILDPVEYTRLLRKIPSDRFQRHLENEQRLLNEVVADLQANDLIVLIDPEELMGLFYALFVTTLHEDEIGVGVFDRALDRLICLVADHIATQGERTIQQL